MIQPAAIDPPLLSVILICYGDHAPLAKRALDGLAQSQPFRQAGQLLVGANACCPETLQLIAQYQEQGVVAQSIISPVNVLKCPLLRRMLPLATGKYALVIDDDTHIAPNWYKSLERFIQEAGEFDLAGEPFVADRPGEYQAVLRRRPWWRNKPLPPSLIVYSPGFYLARTVFLKEHDYPDAGLVIQYQDMLLADLVNQVGGRSLALSEEVLSRVTISDGPTRWDWEAGRNDPVIPATSPTTPKTALEVVVEGQVHQRANRLDQAEALYRQALAFDATCAEAHHLLGMLAHQRGQNELALELVQKSIAHKPLQAEFHNNMGNVLGAMSRFEESIPSFLRALQLKVGYVDAQINLGTSLEKLGRLEEAREQFQQALANKPNSLEITGRLVNVLRQLEQLSEAAEYCRKVIRQYPNHPQPYSNLSLIFQAQGKGKEAIQALDHALKLRPDYVPARMNRAFSLLLNGDFAKGWQEYEWRWKLAERKNQARSFAQPQWQGQPITGKTILVHCEQGLGATLQFIRYVLGLVNHGAKVIVQCQPPLQMILRSLPLPVTVIPQGAPLPAFDVHAACLSLPRLMGTTTLEKIPSPIPYLRADQKLINHWAGQLNHKPGLKVGITWQGNPAYGGDRQRSIPLKHFTPLARVQGVRLYSLQKRWGIEQLRAWPEQLPLIDLAPKLDETTGPFMDTAAVMKNLDLVITSDTSIAHLAGALGVPVWVALCHLPDWRWLLDRPDSPWYPQMRLFRQHRPGDWEEVFGRIVQELATVAEGNQQ